MSPRVKYPRTDAGVAWEVWHSGVEISSGPRIEEKRREYLPTPEKFSGKPKYFLYFTIGIPMPVGKSRCWMGDLISRRKAGHVCRL